MPIRAIIEFRNATGIVDMVLFLIFVFSCVEHFIICRITPGLTFMISYLADWASNLHLLLDSPEPLLHVSFHKGPSLPL